MQHFATTPIAVWNSFFKNRSLIFKLTKREVVGRYRGSMLGLVWSFLNPAFMLGIYTFVFSVVMKTRWGGYDESHSQFALILFSGLMVFTIFSECLNRSPTLVVSNPNYVKKVVFPLEILPYVTMGAALTHFLISFVVWLIFYVALIGVPSADILILPLVIVPLVLMTLGFCWFFASLGVYLRDVAHLMGFATTALLFLTPIFYPASSLPGLYQDIVYLNPLTVFVEICRGLMFGERRPSVLTLLSIGVFSLVIMYSGFVWFQRTRKGFADVV